MSNKTRQADPGVRVEYYDWSGLLPGLTGAAFVLAVAVVVVRATTGDFLREAFNASPGTSAAANLGLPDRTLWLDLLCMVPALLVLLRRVVDRNYILRFTPAHALVLLLSVWAAASTLWASDRFAAAVMSFHFLSAAVLCWSASQLVRSWQRLRVVAAACAGILAILAIHGLYYRLTEVPQLRKMLEDERSRSAIMAERGWTEDSFAWQQFKRKVDYGEMIGFYASPNTNAAMIVVLAMIAAGLAAQRLRDRDEAAWPVILLASLPVAGYVLYYTASRTAFVTPLIGALLMVLGWKYGGGLARNRGRNFAVGCAIILAGAAALIGHGLYHGTLFHESLTFRWHYWVGSAPIVADHPVLGVGYGNFGYHYLAHRLPVASEEIKDPHNLFVRVLVELGFVGALLLGGWLVRAAWEVTKPIVPAAGAGSAAAGAGSPAGTGMLFGIVGTVLALSLFAGVDWSVGWDYAAMELLRRLLYAGVLVLILAAGTVRSAADVRLDDRPAPLLLIALIAAAGIFILHSLVDFVFWETGPMHVFALLLGALLGVRGDSVAGRRKHNRVVLVAASVALVGWLAAMVGFVIPLADAERRAQAGDRALRQREFSRAISLYKAAFESSPVSNADYADRAARAMMYASADPSLKIDPDVIEVWLTQAINANPMDAGYRIGRAMFLMQTGGADNDQIRVDLSRAVALDPNNLQTRLRFAAALESMGNREMARAQLEEVLRLNDLLDPNEPERLPEARINQIKLDIARLSPRE